MAFASTIGTEDSAPEVGVGTYRMTFGTFTAQTAASDVETAGNIDTGLGFVHAMSINYGGAIADFQSQSASPTINETLPATGSAITVHVLTNSSGYWIAFGR